MQTVTPGLQDVVQQNPLQSFMAPTPRGIADLDPASMEAIRAIIARAGVGGLNPNDPQTAAAYTRAFGGTSAPGEDPNLVSVGGVGARAGDRNTDPAVGGTPFTQAYQDWVVQHPNPLATLTGPESSGLAAIQQVIAHLTGQPRMSPEETAAAGTMTSANQLLAGRMGSPLMSGDETAAMANLRRMIDAPVGSSPATTAAIKALEDQYNLNTLPSIENELSRAGLGTSGALGAAIAQARAGVDAGKVAFLQDEEKYRQAATRDLLSEGQVLEGRPGARAGAANQAAAVLAALGGSVDARTMERLKQITDASTTEAGFGATAEERFTGRQKEKLQLGDIIRQISQGKLDAASEDFLRRSGIVENISNVVTGALVPASFGQRGRTETRGGGLLGSLLGGGAKTVILPLLAFAAEVLRCAV